MAEFYTLIAYTPVWVYPMTEWTDYVEERTEVPELVLEIIRRESGGDPEARNKFSTASGLFQFLDSSFKTLCIDKYQLATSSLQKNDAFIQIDCAIQTIHDGGLSHWNASGPYDNYYLHDYSLVYNN